MPTAPKRYQPHGYARSRTECRPNAHQRGYDKHWARLRGLFLKHHPFCLRCNQEGTAEPATEVDHIEPFMHKDDPKRLAWTNLMALCHAHHVRKTHADKRQGKTRRW